MGGIDAGKRRARGFTRTGGLLSRAIQKAGESRGFSEMRLLTHWSEIVGEDVARIARPVKVGYARNGMGATLTVLTSGANAPLVQMQLPRIRERVNATYGYNAISRIRITQTAPTAGFAEPATDFVRDAPKLSETDTARVRTSVAGVADDTLKSALERLGQNVLSKAHARKDNR